MSDPAEAVDVEREELPCGVVIEYEPIGDAKAHLAAIYQGDTLEAGEYTEKVFSSPTVRGQFLNSVEASLEDRDDVNAEQARVELKEWCAKMHEALREGGRILLPDHLRAVLDGTRSVEIHGRETTTVHVTLTYDGRTCDLEFTADEMVGNGGALVSKMANHFFEFDFECEKADWQEIRKYWADIGEVVQVVEETAKDSVADRILEYLSNNLIPVADREDMGNDVASSWFDENNATGCADAPTDGPVLWVQDSFFVDQIEAAGRKTGYKAELVKHLTARGDLFGGNLRKKWAWDRRTRVYPFNPEALGVNGDDLGEGDDPAHSEVSA